MPQTEDIDEKKPGEDGQPPVAETILEQQRDPEEAASAELAIRYFIRDRLEEWHQDMDTAIDSLEAWILSQPQDQQRMFSERAYFDSLGDFFEGALFDVAGGKGTPIMDPIVGEVHNTMSFAEETVHDTSIFINEMRRSIRDACWYMRDACQALLSNQWPDLLDLATGGSLEFVPVLFTMGLPTEGFKPADFADKLTQHGDAYRNAIAPKKEQAEEKANDKGVDEEKKAEAEEEASQLDDNLIDETKKEAQVAI